MKRLLATYQGADGHIIDVFATEDSLLLDDGYKHSGYARRQQLSLQDDVRQALSGFLHAQVAEHSIHFHS